MNRGYVKVWRKIEDSGIIGNADLCQMLMYLMLKATHKDRKISVGKQIVTLRPGQYFAGRKQLAYELGSTERRVRTSLDALKKHGIIDQQATSYGSLISLINWDKYQCESPASDQHSGQRATNERPTRDQRATTKQEHKNINTRREEKREEINTSCPEPLRDSEPEPVKISSPVVLTIPIKGKAAGDYEVTEAAIADWQEAYPAVDVTQALRSIRQWNLAHPDRQKTRKGVVAHIVGWLDKEQNRPRHALPMSSRASPQQSPIMSDKTIRSMNNLQDWVQQ